MIAAIAAIAIANFIQHTLSTVLLLIITYYSLLSIILSGLGDVHRQH